MAVATKKPKIRTVTKETKKEKSHRLLINHDPRVDPLDYTASLMRVLNFYNTEYNNKDKKKWFITHYGKTIKFPLSEVPDSLFRTAGTLCRILDNGCALSDKHLAVLQKDFDLIKATSKRLKAPAVVVAKAGPSIQDKMDEKVSNFLGEFAGLVDDYVMTKAIPDVGKLVTQMGIRGPMVKKVIVQVQKSMEELHDAIDGSDKYLVEGYSNFKKIELKRLLGIYESLINSLQQAKVVAPRKARTPKVKPPVVIAKNVKFMKENKDLNLVSVEPVAVIGCTEAWLYNAKYRKLMVVRAIGGNTLSFKGTSFINYDVNKSTMRTIKKPETLQALKGTRMLSKFYKEQRANETPFKGRINEDTIIVAAFK